MKEVRAGLWESVGADWCPSVFFFFDIGIPYLAHGWITMTQYVAYTFGPVTTLTFHLKVKFIVFLKCLRVRPVTSVCFDIGISNAHKFITMRRCVAYITLTLDLRVKFIGFLTCFLFGLQVFCSLTKSYYILHMSVPHGTMYHIFSWFLYDIDLWPQYQHEFAAGQDHLCSLT